VLALAPDFQKFRFRGKIKPRFRFSVLEKKKKQNPRFRFRFKHDYVIARLCEAHKRQEELAAKGDFGRRVPRSRRGPGPFGERQSA